MTGSEELSLRGDLAKILFCENDSFNSKCWSICVEVFYS